MKTYQLYINGQYVDPVNGEWFDTIDPYRRRGLGEDSARHGRRCRQSGEGANEAMWNGPWAKMTASARGKAMRKLGDLVAANAERLAEIEVRDNGKLMAEMLGQLRYHPNGGGISAASSTSSRRPGADRQGGDLRLHDARAGRRRRSADRVEFAVAVRRLEMRRRARGRLRRDRETLGIHSASTLEFAALTKEAGIPDGIFNVVTGFGPEAGSALISHPGVAKITFTGRTPQAQRSTRPRPRA